MRGVARGFFATEDTDGTELGLDVSTSRFGEEDADVEHLLHEELSGTVRQTAFEVHRYFGFGFAEKVYANALTNRLKKKGIKAEPKKTLTVRDADGTLVGDYEADIVVEDRLLLEIKAASGIVKEHVAQTINYLKITGLNLGLIINFGRPKLELKRIVFHDDPAEYVDRPRARQDGSSPASASSVPSVSSVAKITDNPSP